MQVGPSGAIADTGRAVSRGARRAGVLPDGPPSPGGACSPHGRSGKPSGGLAQERESPGVLRTHGTVWVVAAWGWTATDASGAELGDC